MRFFILFNLMFFSILANGQVHSVTLYPGDTSICYGNAVRISATVSKGSYRYIGTYAGKDYFMDTIARSWTESRTVAKANGLDLWVIENANENNAVYNFIPFRDRVDVMFWIGLYKDSALAIPGNPSNGWKWVNGELLDTSYRNWYFNEPDDAFQSKFPANHAALGLNVLGTAWGDMPDTLPAGYLAYAIAEIETQPMQLLWSDGTANTGTINPSPLSNAVYTLRVIRGLDTVISAPTNITVLNPEATADFMVDLSSDSCLAWNRIVLKNNTVTLDPVGTKYLWNLGDGTSSNVNSLSHQYSAAQTYTIKLTATDRNGCFSFKSRPITILATPLPPIINYPTGKNIFCEGDSVTLNTAVVQPDPNAVLTWYRGIDSVSIGKTYVAKIGGLYSLISTNPNGCTDTAQVTVTVNPLPRKPSISFALGFTGSICSTDSTRITSISPDPAFRFVWYKTANPSPTLLTQTTTGNYTARPAAGVFLSPITEYYQVRILDSKGCYSVFSDSLSVVTRPSPTSVIATGGKPATFCEGDSVVLLGTTNTSGNTFAWTKDNIAIAGIDSNYIAKVNGVYRMTSTNIFGCSRISNPIGVFVNRFPAVPSILLDPNIAELLPDGTVSICNASSTTLRINAVASANYQWFKDNSIITNARNTNVTVNQVGNYRITVTVNNCTTSSLDQRVSIRPAPPGTLLPLSNTIICNGSQLRLDAINANRYQWYLNNATMTGKVDSFLLTGTPGVYKVEFFDEKGCKRMSPNFINLSLVSKPSPAFAYDLYCVNTAANFTNQSQSPNSGSVTYLWRFQNGSTDDAFNSRHVFPDTGLYKVSLSVIPVACPDLVDSAVVNIRVQAPLKGISYTPINAERAKPIGLVARSIGDLYQWRPTTGLNSPFIRIPILNPTTEQLYTVSITNRAGCITTDSILVRIFDEQDVFVASAFTPNRDGKNDKIYPILVGVDVFNYLKIFNRWGTLVYQSNSIDPSKGWDGTYKGNDQPADTYTWVVDAVGQNGKPIRKSGSIVLIR